MTATAQNTIFNQNLQPDQWTIFITVLSTYENGQVPRVDSTFEQ